MRRPLLLCLLTALLAALALGLARCGGDAVAAPRADAPRAQPADPRGAPASAAPGERAAPPAVGDARETSTAPTQGLRGLLLDAAQQPIAGAPVFAFAAAAPDPWTRLLRQRRGERLPPVATATTARDGAFALALADDDVGQALWIVAAATNGDGVWPAAAVRTAQWSDLGALPLPPGVSLRGTVRAAGDDTPIQGARVAVQQPPLDELALPERDAGRGAITGVDGSYRISGLRPGRCTVTASAEGHATATLPQQQLFADEDNALDFGLARGHERRGVVVDPQGRGVGDAFVRATPTQGDVGAVTARSAANGDFALRGLADVPVHVTAAAPGYQPTAPVTTAVDDAAPLRLVLQPLGGLRLAVHAADGAVVTRWRAVLRGAGAGPRDRLRRLGPIAVAPDQLSGDAYSWTGVDPGDWQVEVVAPGHAPTVAGPFAIAAGTITDVQIALRAGAVVRGRVTDRAGRPLAGAQVRALPDDRLGGDLGAVQAALRAALVEPHARSAADGGFALPNLAAGAVRLQVEHPDAAPARPAALQLQDGQDLDVGTVALAPPARVTGRVLRGDALDPGAPVPPVVVQLVALDAANLPLGFAVETTAAADGTFAFAERLPPGRFAAMAGRRTADNPVLENADRGRSRVEFELAAGERRALQLRLTDQ
ncbi:MAG: carboxypeptidase regulatory-like domain-containing protein [Planctomycetota bacterium]